MNSFDLKKLTRPNIRQLVPYSAARHEYVGEASLFLDANECSMTTFNGYNRYPDPLQKKLKQRIRELKRVSEDQIFLGNGSDEPIDLLFRCFCEPGQDNVILFPPTYGMYEVAAAINNVKVRNVLLTPDYQIDITTALDSIDDETKLIFICSPNNPTGNLMQPEVIKKLLQRFNGIVVVDEAYVDFTDQVSWTQTLDEFQNLVVLQTFSKAWGLAGLRLGMAFASKDIIAVLNKVKPPYNISSAAQNVGLRVIEAVLPSQEYIRSIKVQRPYMICALQQLPFITQVSPSDANFILVKVKDANSLYQYLITKGIVVRNRSTLPLCDNCLRITLGTVEENERLLAVLNAYKQPT